MMFCPAPGPCTGFAGRSGSSADAAICGALGSGKGGRARPRSSPFGPRPSMDRDSCGEPAASGWREHRLSLGVAEGTVELGIGDKTLWLEGECRRAQRRQLRQGMLCRPGKYRPHELPQQGQPAAGRRPRRRGGGRPHADPLSRNRPGRRTAAGSTISATHSSPPGWQLHSLTLRQLTIDDWQLPRGSLPQSDVIHICIGARI